MEIRAYDESYLNTAQNILGHAVDFAVLSLGLTPDTFGEAFAISDSSKQFASGNPRYIAGMTGCELARKVLEETKISYRDTDDKMYIDKSPEYWAGWALAFYQWYSSLPFLEILEVMPLSKIINMYDIYHEIDIIHFADRMEEVREISSPSTRLKIRRMNCNLSQSKLASESGVALRQIQLFEQRKRDINNAAAITLLRLSKALHCNVEDLLEVSTHSSKL